MIILSNTSRSSARDRTCPPLAGDPGGGLATFQQCYFPAGLKIYFALIYFFLPGFLLAQELESNLSWQKITLEKAGCAVMAPGPMTEKVDTVETPIGKIAYHTYFYQSAEKGPENFFYMLSYCEYPEGAVHSDSMELLNEFFETTIESAAAAVNGDLIFANEITLQDYPGRFWRINYLDDQVIIRTKAYMVKNRYYAIQTIMHKDRSLNPASDRFLDSLQLF